MRARQIGSFIRRRYFFWRIAANFLGLLVFSFSETVA